VSSISPAPRAGGEWWQASATIASKNTPTPIMYFIISIQPL
jgi:hypothetical protein